MREMFLQPRVVSLSDVNEATTRRGRGQDPQGRGQVLEAEA